MKEFSHESHEKTRKLKIIFEISSSKFALYFAFIRTFSMPSLKILLCTVFASVIEKNKVSLKIMSTMSTMSTKSTRLYSVE